MDDFNVEDEMERIEDDLPELQDLAEVDLNDDPNVVQFADGFRNALGGDAA